MAVFSIVVPVYNEEIFIKRFYEEIKRNAYARRDFEIVFVNDGSTDFSYKILKEIADSDKNVRILSLDRNYGKQTAITAGMAVAKGNAVIVMNISKHNPQIAINSVLTKWMAGYEIVYGSRSITGWELFKEKFKYNFFKTCMRLFGVKGQLIRKPTIELYDRKVVDIINTMPDKNMYLRNVNTWVDYKIAAIEYAPKDKLYETQEAEQAARTEMEKERVSKNLPAPVKLKKRLYAASWWTAWGTFTAGIITGITCGLLAILIKKMPVLVTFFLALAAIVLLAVSALSFVRGLMIKRLGIMPSVKSADEIYRVAEYYHFD